MDRLTGWNKGNSAYYVNCFDESAPCGGGMPGKACGECAFDRKHCEKLAAYEDSGLTPERAQELGKAEHEGRIMMMSGKYTLSDGKEALQKAMYMVSVTNYPINRYIADAVAEKVVRDEAALKADTKEGKP